MAIQALDAPQPIAWKALAATGLLVLADVLLWGHEPGALFGVFLLTWVAATAVVLPDIRRDWRALAALVAAAAFAAVQVETFSPLAALMFGAAISLAALLPQTTGFDDAWRWFQRLSFNALAATLRPVFDLGRLMEATASRRAGLPRLAVTLVLPLVGGAVFLGLFALANPIIGDALARLRLPPLTDETIIRVIFWGAVFGAVWSVFRATVPRRVLTLTGDTAAALPGVTTGSVLLSLIVFNVIFALQNGLDLVFLWSGAPLPDGVTLADYAHRGAYPLIATALLAGLFVVVTLRPGTETGKSPFIRRLVVLWTAQNLLLVASSILRTLDYVEVYSLTGLRIAALVWMGLVATGLALICWRLVRGKSEAWLINANTLAAALVLAGGCVVDLNAIAAAWNVRHAREVGGHGAPLDLKYLERLGPSALVSLARLEQQLLEPAFRQSVAWARYRTAARLAEHQADPYGWTWRGARRLAKAQEIVAAGPAPYPLTATQER